MLKTQIKANIKELDNQIGELALLIKGERNEQRIVGYLERMDRLVELRAKLAESSEASSIKRELITGAIGIASVALILKYEESNVITSKAISLALKPLKMFRG